MQDKKLLIHKLAPPFRENTKVNLLQHRLDNLLHDRPRKEREGIANNCKRLHFRRFFSEPCTERKDKEKKRKKKKESEERRRTKKGTKPQWTSTRSFKVHWEHWMQLSEKKEMKK
jgi:hypothetical protein